MPMGKVSKKVQFVKIGRVKLIHKKLGREQAWGLADVYTNKIWLDPRLRGKRRLEITVHELMHLLYPRECEENVEHAGKVISRILWREGWRKIEK